MKTILLYGNLEEDNPLIMAALSELIDLPKVKQRRTVELVVASDGGRDSIGRALIGAIERARRRGWRVATHVIGKACSAAALVAAAGDRGWRTIDRHATAMVHLSFLGGLGESNTRDLEVSADMMRAHDARWFLYLGSVSRRSAEDWRQLLSDRLDHWLLPEEYVSLGLADKVV